MKVKKVRVYGLAMYWKDNKKKLLISFVDVKNSHYRGSLDIDFTNGLTEDDIKNALVKAKVTQKENIEIVGHILCNLPLTGV